MNGFLDVGSRIIQNMIVLDDNKGRCDNVNRMRLEYFMNNYDYECMSKLDVVSSACGWFYEYMMNIGEDRKGILLEKENEYLLKNYEIKYSVSYKNKIIRRMNWLNHKYRTGRSVLLTLTVDPKIYGCLTDMWIDIKKQQNRFLTRLKQVICCHREYCLVIEDGKEDKLCWKHLKYREFPKYISTIECHHGEKSWMNPHIHMVFIGANRLCDWRIIKDIWKMGRIYINRDGKNKKVRKPVDYVTKYITKTYTDSDNINFRDQAVQWFFNVRSFSYSKGLIWPLNYNIGDFNFVFNVRCDSNFIFEWFDLNLDSYMKGFYEEIYEKEVYK